MSIFLGHLFMQSRCPRAGGVAATSGVGVEGLCGVERRSCVGLAVMPTVSKSHEVSKSERIARNLKPWFQP